MAQPVLTVSKLRTYFYLDEGVLKAVDGVTFDVNAGKTLGIIGESGCGKSVTAQSILQIVPPPGKLLSGEILLRNGDSEPRKLHAMKADSPEIRAVRGKEISMIFQEPMTSLSPVHTIGSQIMEAVLLHVTEDKKEARERAIEMLSKVGIPMPAERIDAYPHQLSGGLRQRAMIAMALSCNPKVLIADEPTTALDVTIQAQILELMKNLQDQFGMSILYITHDLGVIAEISEDVAVMYLGKVVEHGRAVEIFNHPKHPYTVSLLRSIPRVGRKSNRKLDAIKGTVPIPLNMPKMCGFFSRCQSAMKGKCDVRVPELLDVDPGHAVRCFLFNDKDEEE